MGKWKPPAICPYCRRPAALVPGAAMYPGRYEFADRFYWRCGPCGAWVGCHPDTKRPLGRLANADLRKAKQAAHAVFDPLWQAKIARQNFTRGAARRAGYRWLAEQLGIEPKRCHIGMMDEAQCARVVAICSPHVERLKRKARPSCEKRAPAGGK